MTWRQFFNDPGHRSELLAAARECTRLGCSCGPDGEAASDPAYCDCRSNLMTPIEFADWIEDEVLQAEREAGVERPDYREHMSRRQRERAPRPRERGRYASAV